LPVGHFVPDEHLWEIILLKHKEMMVVLWNSL